MSSMAGEESVETGATGVAVQPYSLVYPFCGILLRVQTVLHSIANDYFPTK